MVTIIMAIVIVTILILLTIIFNFVDAHQELRNDMPVVPQGLTYCFMRYDSKDNGEEKDTYLECNMVEGFTQEQLRGMRDTLENMVDEK